MATNMWWRLPQMSAKGGHAVRWPMVRVIRRCGRTCGTPRGEWPGPQRKALQSGHRLSLEEGSEVEELRP